MNVDTEHALTCVWTCACRCMMDDVESMPGMWLRLAVPRPDISQ